MRTQCSFFEKFGVLSFPGTPVLRFALLPYYRRITLLFRKKLSLETQKTDGLVNKNQSDFFDDCGYYQGKFMTQIRILKRWSWLTIALVNRYYQLHHGATVLIWKLPTLFHWNIFLIHVTHEFLSLFSCWQRRYKKHGT